MTEEPKGYKDVLDIVVNKKCANVSGLGPSSPYTAQRHVMMTEVFDGGKYSRTYRAHILVRYYLNILNMPGSLEYLPEDVFSDPRI